MRAALWTGMFSRLCEEPEDTVRELAFCGFTVAELSEIELARLLASDDPEARTMQFRRYCNETGMVLSQAHMPNIFNFDNANDLEALFVRFEKAFRLLEMLAVPVAVFHPLKKDGAPEGISVSEINKSFFSKVLRIGEKYNVRPAAENLIGMTRSEIRLLLDSVPGLGLNLDTAHASSSGWDIASAVREFAKELAGLHISDNNGESYDMHLIPGKGHLQWDSIVREIRLSGYCGDFHLELPHERADAIEKTREAAMRALDAAKEILCRQY